MADNKKYTWNEIQDMFFEYNREHPSDDEYLTAVAVITPDSFDKPYSETERSYKFTSNNYGFQSGKISNSIWADCLDGKDLGVRLDWYLYDGWKVDYCYLVDNAKTESKIKTEEKIRFTSDKDGTEYVLWHTYGDQYKITSAENNDAYVMDARKIKNLTAKDDEEAMAIAKNNF